MFNTIFFISLSFHFISAYFFYKGKIRYSVLLLFVANFLLRYWGAGLDPFLNDWDERFHALVAKNLTHHCLMPTLFDTPLLSYDYKGWYGNHIWLHKQPLFLWQMAFSIKLFGNNTFAVRFPSIFLGAFLIFIIFDLVKLCFNSSTGYLAAFLFSFYEPILGMSSGYSGMDHNTLSFIFYTTASIWAWAKFEKDKKPGWIILMGIFSGCAILCKWLTGLLVFSGFGFYHLFITKDFFTKSMLLFLFYASVACIITALPWQVFTLYKYPLEAQYELHYNGLHFSQALEGHSEGTWYYINLLKEQYKMLQSLIFIGFGFCVLQYKRFPLALSLIAMCVLVYTFFTIAETKMDEYVLLVSPLMISFMAFAIFKICRIFLSSWIDYKKPMLLFTVVASFQLFDYNGIMDSQSDAATGWLQGYRNRKLKDTRWIMEHKSFFKENDVVINCPEFEYVDGMFFTSNSFYGFVDSLQRQQLLRQKKHLIDFGS